MPGEHKPAFGVGRLAQALAAWDVQACRTLSRRPNAADLMVTTATQALITLAGQTLLRAAADTGAIDAAQYRSRLAPALELVQSGWASMTATWRDLTPPSARRIDPDLARAAGEARAALLDLVHDRTTLASSDVLVERVDLAAASRTVQQAISASVDLAHVIQDATDDLQLTGAARAVNAMASAAEGVKPEVALAAPEAGWVSPRELADNRPVPLPDPVRDLLTVRAERTIHATTTAMSAATLLDRTLARSAPSFGAEPTNSSRRENRPIPLLPPPRPDRGGPQP